MRDELTGSLFAPNIRFATPGLPGPFKLLGADLPVPENLSLVSKQQKRTRQFIFVVIAATVFLMTCWLLI